MKKKMSRNMHAALTTLILSCALTGNTVFSFFEKSITAEHIQPAEVKMESIETLCIAGDNTADGNMDHVRYLQSQISEKLSRGGVFEVKETAELEKVLKDNNIDAASLDKAETVYQLKNYIDCDGLLFFDITKSELRHVTDEELVLNQSNTQAEEAFPVQNEISALAGADVILYDLKSQNIIFREWESYEHIGDELKFTDEERIEICLRRIADSPAKKFLPHKTEVEYPWVTGDGNSKESRRIRGILKKLYEPARFGDYETVVDNCRNLLKEHPENAAVHHCLGLGLGLMNEFDPATKHLEKAVKLNPERSEHKEALELIKKRQNDIASVKSASDTK